MRKHKAHTVFSFRKNRDGRKHRWLERLDRLVGLDWSLSCHLELVADGPHPQNSGHTYGQQHLAVEAAKGRLKGYAHNGAGPTKVSDNIRWNERRVAEGRGRLRESAQNKTIPTLPNSLGFLLPRTCTLVDLCTTWTSTVALTARATSRIATAVAVGMMPTSFHEKHVKHTSLNTTRQTKAGRDETGEARMDSEFGYIYRCSPLHDHLCTTP